jgi:Protein of unknown function (DUF732)
MRERAGRGARHTAHGRRARRSVAVGGGAHQAGGYPDEQDPDYADYDRSADYVEHDDVPHARRAAAGGRGTRRGGLRSRVSRRSAEPIAIIGGSVVEALVGRLRGGYAIADVESSTAELEIITAADRRRGRARGSRWCRPAGAGRPPVGSARQRLRRRRQQLATLAIGAMVAVALVAGGVAVVWPDPAPGSPSPAVATPDDPEALPAYPDPSPADQGTADQGFADQDAEDQEAGESDAGSGSSTDSGGLDQDSAGQNPTDSSLTARDTESYLDGLRTADIAVSDDGRAEREAGDAICEQLQRGVAESEIERALPAMLTTVGARQATTVVDLVQRYYCV